MTSIPASRSARAMILAPRSCPSSPGFAITTLIFFATMGQYMNREADGRWMLPRLAEPGQRTVRLSGPVGRKAPAARLRAWCARAAAEHERRLAPGGRYRGHALAPR